VDAIEMGRKAASSIDKYLGGTGEIEDMLIEPDIPNPWLGLNDNFHDESRVQMPLLSSKERYSSFKEIELGYNETSALKEANRCLRCDLRFEISPIVLPPQKRLELTKENIQAVPEIEGAIHILNENQ